MYNKFLFLTLTSMALSSSVFSNPVTPGENAAVDIIQPARFVSKNGNYSIQFPATWEIMPGVMGTDVIAMAPASDPQDLFKKNANIIFAVLDKNIAPEDYYSLNLKSLGNLLVDFDLEESKDVVLGGLPAKELIFTHTMGVINVQVLQYLILNGNKAYVITFTANRSDFEKYRKTFEQTANTLHFDPIPNVIPAP